MGNKGQVNYSAAQAGLQGFTKTLAIERGRFGITANAVEPGFIETVMTKVTAERVRVSFENMVKNSVNKIPVGRSGETEDAANAVMFYAMEESYIYQWSSMICSQRTEKLIQSEIIISSSKIKDNQVRG